MNLLHYRTNHDTQVGRDIEELRYSRDALGDLKHGLDLVFELKSQLDKMHPIAAETLIRMIAQ